MTCRFHAVAGLPRSGSTLLCNLLAQRPDVHVSSTSALPNVLGAVSGVMTQSAEVTSDLVAVPATAERAARVLDAVVGAWYAHVDEPVVIDKSRGWGPGALLLQRVRPEAVVLVTIRDPREVIASIERQHRRTAEYGATETLWARTSAMMAPTGLVGGPMTWVEDMVRRRLSGVSFVSYESLTVDPLGTLRRVDDALGLAPHGYDTTDVVSVATDVDALYRFKFPHVGAGPVEARPGGWSDVIDDELAAQIAGRYPFYMRAFGYGTNPPAGAPARVSSPA